MIPACESPKDVLSLLKAKQKQKQIKTATRMKMVSMENVNVELSCPLFVSVYFKHD